MIAGKLQSIVEPPEFLVWALFGLSVLGLAMTWLSDRAVARVLSPHRRRATAPLPPLSILKPVKGVDDGLRDNLLSIALQQYPEFEVLIGAERPDDPALAVAREVAREAALVNPHVRVRIHVCPDDGGLNPKVSILRRLSALARHDLVLISDSNVRARPGYLESTVGELSGDVGLVSHLVASEGEQNVAAVFEGLHLVSFVARAMSLATVYLGRPCVVGKSMLFRLSSLRRVGGWALVRDVLAEDYAIGKAFSQAGLQVIHAPAVLFTYNRHWPLARFVNRHLRWGQMRRRVCLGAYLCEPLFNPGALFVLTALFASIRADGPSWILPACGLGIALKFRADRLLWKRMRGEDAPLKAMLLALPKDLLVLGLWAIATVRRTIDWRGNVLLVGPGSRLMRPSGTGWLSRRRARTADAVNGMEAA
jgi:ceramide glucosyltransferase